MTNALRYPLHWPHRVRRTIRRVHGPYKVTQGKAQRDLMHELKLMGARDVIVSTNVKTRRDGLPYGDGLPYASQPRPADPGVALWFHHRGKDRVITCDRFKTVRSNMRAIGLTIFHLRRVEQAAPSIAEQIFDGFAALPENAGGQGRPWRVVLEYPNRYSPTLRQLKHHVHQLLKRHHPDVGGQASDAAEINRAFADAKRELGYL